MRNRAEKIRSLYVYGSLITALCIYYCASRFRALRKQTHITVCNAPRCHKVSRHHVLIND